MRTGVRLGGVETVTFYVCIEKLVLRSGRLRRMKINFY